MEREEIEKSDFPRTDDGYDTGSVDAHLRAVSAQLGALEERVRALSVEIDALRAVSPPSNPAPSGEPERTGPEETAEGGADEVSARLVATEMLLAGRDRDEVVVKLGDQYGLDDPAALVDEVARKLT